MFEDINIICIGDLRYRFAREIIKCWDFDFSKEILRIDFKDNSFIEFFKKNIVCVEFNTKEAVSK